MKKHEYSILINGGTKSAEPLEYRYRSTKNIQLHLKNGKARICFAQSVDRKPEALLTSNDDLCTDAMKKALLLHLIMFSVPLDIKQLDLEIDGEIHSVMTRKAEDDPLIFSMVERPLDHPFPEGWRNRSVLETILNTPKSAYDGRFNALIALLLGKSEYYRSQKSMYLWMAMNGFYNYLTNQCKLLPECTLGFKHEYKQHEYLCAVVTEMYRVEHLKDDAKTDLFRKGVSSLKRCELSPETVFEIPESVTEGLTLSGTDNSKRYVISPKSFLTIWLPYQIRCNYFHNNAALPLFSYEDEPLLKALSYTNYFVERFLEENLPYWLTSKEITEEQEIRIREAYVSLMRS